MKTLIFATGNVGKIAEVNEILRGVNLGEWRVRSMREIGQTEDLPETQPTIKGNAQQKAHFLYEKFKCDCFSEDTGLEIDALNGEPGVKTARYAGEGKNTQDNINLVLQKLDNQTNRKARFRTVITLILGGVAHNFEGVCEGEIRQTCEGEGGFGYDPIFQPEGYNITFAEMNSIEKNKISHRGKAVAQLLDFLKNI